MKLEPTVIYRNLVEFFIQNEGYVLVAVDQKESDTWLVKQGAKQYPIIRVSIGDKPSKNLFYLTQVRRSIGKILNIDNEILDLYITEAELKEQDQIRQVISFNEASVTSNKLDFSFKGINQVFTKTVIPKKSVWKLTLERFLTFKVTTIISLICIILYFVSESLGQIYGEGPAFVFLGAIYKHLLYGANQWWRLLAAGFLHGGLSHILLNLVAFTSLGRLSEQVYGAKKTLIILLSSIIVGSLSSLVTSGSNTVSLGLSGGLYGLLAATIIYFYRSRLIFVPGVAMQIIQIVAINIFISLLPGISFWGHIGGFIGGFLMTLLIEKGKKPKLWLANLVGAYLILISGLLLYAYRYDPHTELIINNVAINNQVIQMRRDFKLDYFADIMESKLIKYYEMKGWVSK